MDFHDVMELSVKGQGVQSIQVYDVNEQGLVVSSNVTTGVQTDLF